jgi:hypothetical protein
MTSENRLLAALSARAFDRITLTLKSVLHKPGEPVQHVYFPGGGFCSVLTVLGDGNMVEVATIGREGMVGISTVVNGGARSVDDDSAGRKRRVLPDIN